jgi:hypothetical protein
MLLRQPLSLDGEASREPLACDRHRDRIYYV